MLALMNGNGFACQPLPENRRASRARKDTSVRLLIFVGEGPTRNGDEAPSDIDEESIGRSVSSDDTLCRSFRASMSHVAPSETVEDFQLGTVQKAARLSAMSSASARQQSRLSGPDPAAVACPDLSPNVAAFRTCPRTVLPPAWHAGPAPAHCLRRLDCRSVDCRRLWTVDCGPWTVRAVTSPSPAPSPTPSSSPRTLSPPPPPATFASPRSAQPRGSRASCRAARSRRGCVRSSA